MIKFTRSTKKKLDKVRHSSGTQSSNNGGGPPRHGGSSSGHHSSSSGHHNQVGDRSVSSAYSAAHSQYSTRSDYTDGTENQQQQQQQHRGGGGRSSHGRHRSRGGGASVATSSTAGGSRRYSSAQSVQSISSASVFAPSVVSGAASTGGQGGLQPSSARLLRDLNKSAHSSLLSSLGTAASRTFRSYKMSLPRCPPPVRGWSGSASASGSNLGGSGALSGSNNNGIGIGGIDEESVPVETDLELLGRTVHAVSSALTEPPKEGDKYMIYDVSFNPKGCVWDALIVVQVKDDEDEKAGEDKGDDNNASRSSHNSRRGSAGKGGGSSSRIRSRSRSESRSSRSIATADGGVGSNGKNKTFTFPVRVTCAEDDDVEDLPTPDGRPRAKTYAVDLSVIDDSVHHPISRWSSAEAAEHRDDMKNAMEWISYGVRRSMARSMFPVFPEGCQGKQFREVYQLNKKLKSGTFSTVCRGVHRATGRQVAVKCILRKKIEPSVDAAVFEEVLIMSGLHHKYICPMIDYFEEDRCHFVIMELERGGDLCERLNDKTTYSEADARTVARNVCEAMEFVHSKGFAHCDIKPRNYLLRSKKDDVDVRLADFGFAQHVHAPNSLTSQCGTPFFVAPEVINRKPYDQKVDMWSIGVTCYLLLCGDTPFNGKNRQQLFRRISCDEATFSDEKWGHVSDEGVDFVRKLLAKDPAKRLSAAQALSHPWLTETNSMMAQQQQQQQVRGIHSAGESSEDILDRKQRGSSRGPSVGRSSSGRSLVKSPSKATSAANHHANDVPPSPRTQSVSREGNIKSNRSISRDRSKSNTNRRSVSRDNTTRSVSRERTNINHRGAPPPPPKPQAPPRDSSVPQSVDENARLLDVIKNQDAKIEKLERMVKRMMEPEGDVHEC
mmetsp:Transcript_28547/g.60860  ORF Transcript_28547/g.60860 Transcript_28547/m.60860 type:complete len:893 (+) Transcript_28547:206-2884(+)